MTLFSSFSRALILFTCCIVLMATKCSQNDLIKDFVNSDPLLKKIHQNKDQYEVQIIYTQINRDKNNIPTFNSYKYNVDKNFYHYPASTVKMPIAVLALQRLNELKKETGLNLNLHTPIYHFAYRPPQSDNVVDEITGKAPTIANYIDQIFCTSDNNAYNRLFEFLGAEYINKELYKIGAFTTSHIIHRVGISGFSYEDNQYLPEIQFKNHRRELIHTIKARKSTYSNRAKIKDLQKGKGYINSNDELVNKPFDFSQKNFYCLEDFEETMKRVLFPEAYPENKRFNLTDEDYKFLRRSMSILPRELEYFAQDTHYYDTYVKFFYDGDRNSIIPNDLKIYNKVGWAYGYLTDCSYFHNQSNGVEFLLTAAIKVNKNEIFNDGVYEYEEIGLPFFRALGKKVYQYEENRKRK